MVGVIHKNNLIVAKELGNERHKMLEILGLVGLTLILVNGKIFNTPRNILTARVEVDQTRNWFIILLHALFTCSQCSGMWVGIIGSIWLYGISKWWLIPIVGGVVSVLSVFVDFLFSYMFNRNQSLELMNFDMKRRFGVDGEV